MNTSPILYGMSGSLYTAKVRSYLRKQRIAFEERIFRGKYRAQRQSAGRRAGCGGPCA
jgi:hypothetical protein